MVPRRWQRHAVGAPAFGRIVIVASAMVCNNVGMLNALIPSKAAAVKLCLVGVMTILAACSTSHSPGVESSSGSAPEAKTVFGDELSLTGYDVRTNGGHTEVELRWSAVRKPTADYQVFVHVLDGSGGLAFQADHDLKDEAGAHTAAWKLGESVKDRFSVAPPPGHAAGTYTLRLGLYIPSPIKVLPLANSAFNQPTDAWRIQSIIIDHVECK